MTRGKPKCETIEYAGMVRRMVRSWGRRVGAADDADLAEMVAMRGHLEEAITEAVRLQREGGASWADVARGLGTSRQYAQRTYGGAS